MPPLLRRITSAAALALATTFAADASADQEKRPDQDYGHPKEGTDAGDVVAWPVRVVLFPLYLVNEYILRRPAEALVKFVEKNDVVDAITNFFTFGPEDNITIFPSALFDFGLLPSVGFNLTFKDFFAKPNTLRLHFGTWGPDWISLKASDTYDFSKKEHLSVTTQLIRRSDNPFFGLGPKTHQGNESRYGSQTFELAPTYDRYLWRESAFSATAGARGTKFYHGTCCGDPSIDSALNRGTYPLPFGYGPAYYGGFQRASLSFDNRLPRPQPGSGVRVEGHEETMFDLSNHHDQTERSWIKYGGSVAGAWDINGKNRVLGAKVDVELADPIRGQVPFTEQVALGGDELFPGYIIRRLVDKSATVAQIQYTWPIWMYLDGVIAVSAGNVWGNHFDDFKLKDSRLTGAFGVRSNGERDSGFELTIGAGTDPLSEGFNVSSFRFFLGSHHGL